MKIRPKLIAPGIGLAALLLASNAPAQNLTWNGTTGSTWGTTTNWSPNRTPTSSSNATILGPSNAAGNLTIDINAAAAANTVNFTNTSGNATSLTNTTSGANQTLALGNGTTGSLTTSTGAVTIGSSTANQGVNIALSGNNTWTIGTGGLTVNNAISSSTASAGITKNGTGTLTLAGANTYNGSTAINAGTVQYSGNTSMSSNSAITMATNTTLSLLSDSNATFTPASLTGAAGAYTISLNQLTGNGTGKTLTLANNFQMGNNGANLTVSSTSGDTLLLSNQLFYGGGASPSTSTINLSGANVTLNAGVNYNGVANGNNLIVNGNSNTLLINGTWTVSTNRWSNITVNSGTVTMNYTMSGVGGVNSGVGTTLNGGVLNINNTGVIGGNGGAQYFYIYGGTIDNTSGSAKTLSAYNPPVTLGGNFAFSTSAGTANNSLNLGTGAVTNNGSRTITLNGAGNLTFGGTMTNTLAGNNTLTVNNGSGTTATTAINFTNATAYALSNSATNYVDVINGNGTVNITGNITNGSSTASGLTYSGTGTLNLSGANSTYGGPTLVSGGTLALTGNGAINSSSGITVNGSGAKFVTTSAVASTPAITLTQGTLDGKAATVGNVTVASLAANTVQNGNGSGTGTLTIGKLTFTGNGTLNIFEVGTTKGIGVTGALVTANTGLGEIVVNASNSAWTTGTTYDLITYGSLTGNSTDFIKGTISNLTGRQSSSLGNSGTAITLNVSGDTPVWSGAASSALVQYAVSTPLTTGNLALKTGHTATDFWTGDNVEFNDTYNVGAGDVAVSRTTVNINGGAANAGGIAATGITFNNSAIDYTITSSDSTGITAGTLTKNGTGKVIITNSNSYNGSTTISAGTLQFGNGTAGNDGALTGTSGVTNNATLAYNLFGNSTASYGISGNGSLTKSGAGTLVLSGTNSYTGNTTINSGTIQAGSNSALGATTSALVFGASSSGKLQVNGYSVTVGSLNGDSTATIENSNATAGTLTVNSTGTDSFAGVIQNGSAGTLALTKGGAGTLILTGANTYNGTTTISAGTLQLGNNGTTGKLAAGSAIVNNANLTINRSNAVVQGTDFSSAAISGSGSLTLAGSGNTTLNVANTYTGGTTVNAGTLILSTGGSAGAIRGTLTINSGAIVKATVGDALGYGTGTSVTQLNIIGGTFDNASANNEGYLTNVSLTGGNITGSGGASSAFDFNGTNITSLASATSSVISSGVRIRGNGNTLTANVTDGAAATDLLISGVISNPEGTGALSKSGNGTLVLSGNNTYTGGTTVSAGVLQTGSALALNSGLVTVNGGTLDLNGYSQTVSGLAGSGGTVNNQGSASAVTLTLNETGAHTFSGTIANGNGTLSLVKTGSGNSTLSGNNTFSGGATVKSGQIVLGHAAALGTGTLTLGDTSGNSTADVLENLAGTTFANNIIVAAGSSGVSSITALNGGNTNVIFSGNVTLNKDLTINAWAATDKSSGGQVQFSGIISGTGNIIVDGNSNTNLPFAYFSNGANNITGNITIQNNAALRTANGALSTSNVVTIGSSSQLNTNGQSLSIAGLNGSGTVVVSNSASQSLTLGGNGSYSSSAVISGAGGLTKSGSGTQVLSGNNTYTGATTITAGTLQIGNGTDTGNITSSASITNNGLLVYNVGSGTRTYANVISGNGTLTQNSSGGILALSNNNTYTGATTINVGTLQIGNGGSTGSLSTSSAITNNGTLAFSRNNTMTQGTDFASVIAGTGNVVQASTGTLVLSVGNTYSGATSIQSGTLSFNTGNASASATQSLGTNRTVNIGVLNTSSGTLLYTGAAGTLAKDINALGNGQNVIQNSGGGLLTLTGTLTKNGTILVLKGGSSGIAVNGTIAGSASNSDLYIDGGTTTLNAANTYNGPTKVYNAGTLALGINNAIPSGSAVTLGDATTSGTLDMGSFTNTIASLSFGAGNGTLKLAANQTGSAQLAASGTVALGTGNSINLTGMGTSAGIYKLVSGSSLNGTFTTVTGLDGNYTLQYGTLNSNELDAQHKATISLALGTNAANVHVGSQTVNLSIGNTAFSGSADLNYTLGGVSGTGTRAAQVTSAGTGTYTASAGVNSFNITASDGNATNSPQSVAFSQTGYNLAAANATQTVNVGAYHVGVGKTASVTLANTATANATYTETLQTAGFSGTSTNFSAGGSAGGIIGGGSGSGNLTVGVATGLGAGAQSGSTVLALQSNAVNGSGLGTTGIGNQTVTINATGYNLAAANATQTVNVGNMHVGETKTASVTLANTAPTNATYTETLSSNGFSGTTANFTATGSVTGIAGGGSGSGNLTVGLGSGLSAGAASGTTTLALNSNAVNSSGLGTTGLTAQTVTITGGVYNLASASTLTTPVTLANVRVGGTFGTSAVSLTNTAPTAGGYSEQLDAAFIGTTGNATNNGGTVSLLAAQGNDTTSLVVGLGGNATTATAGAKTGTTTIGFTSNGTGTSGLASTVLSNQTVTVSGAVYNAAAVNTLGNVTLTNVHVGDAFTTSALTITNTAASGNYTEGLNATKGATSGSASIGGTNISNLAGGSSSTTIAVGLGGNATTGTAGAKTGTATIAFASSGTNSGLSDLALGNQTVTVNGGVYNLASANTLTTPVVLKTRVGGNFTESAVTVTNTAASGNFTEHLDASGSAGGNATTSGSISGLAGGTTNNSTLLVGMTADTSTSGNKTGGTVTVALTSNGTGTSGLGNTLIAAQDILVSGVAYDYAKPVYSKDGGNGTFTSLSATTYTMDFGTGLSLGSIYTATIRLTNEFVSGFQDSLGGSYTALSGAPEISTNLGTLPVSIGTLAPTNYNTFTISFNAGTAGTFGGSLTFRGISEQAGLADASLPGGDITINILGATTAAVPEPSAWAAMFVGVSTFLLLRRRRRKA